MRSKALYPSSNPLPVVFRSSKVAKQHWSIQVCCNGHYCRKRQEVRIKRWHNLRHLGFEANGENHKFQKQYSGILQNTR